jgi:hypothetical protein
MRDGEAKLKSDDRLFVDPEHPVVCALSSLELGRSVVRYVNDAGSEIHLSPTDLASPLRTQEELLDYTTKFANLAQLVQ